MARIVRYSDGRTVVRAEGGYRNNEVIPPEEIEITEPLKKVEEFDFKSDQNSYGEAVNTVKVFKDASGKIVAIRQYIWYPAPGYSWQESWEKFVDPEYIMQFKVEQEEEI